MYSSTKNPSFEGNQYKASYLCPSIFNGSTLTPREQLDPQILTWLDSALQEGDRFLKSQPFYGDLERAIDLVMGKLGEKYPKMSNVNVNLLKKAIREDVATLSNLRPSWLYESNSSDDPTWITQASILNRCSKYWYQATFVREQIKSWLQYGFTHGVGYLSPVWNPNFHDKGLGDIELRVYNYDEVKFVGMNRDNNHQQAYATIIKETTDIRKAWRMFPSQAHKIFPTISGTTSNDSLLARAGASLSALIKGSASDPKPTKVDLFYCYIDDYTCNPLDKAFKMGNGSWEYTVPAKGDDIADGFSQDGSQRVKRATEEDCLLYPNRRLLICTKDAVLYDNTSFYWHGKVPLVSFCPDAWVWSHVGASLALELEPITNSFNSMNRGMEDGMNLALDPPGMVDDTLTSKSTAEKSFRVPGRKIRSRLNMGEIFKPFVPPGSYSPSAVHFNWLEKAESWIEEIAGAPSLKALDQARQIPTSDTVEKFFSVKGAITTDMSQSMDKPVWQLADMNRHNFFQFYDKQRRMFLLGESGKAPEDDDFDAGTMIPALIKQHKPMNGSQFIPYDFDPDTLIPQSFPNEPMPVLSSRTMRAKWHIRNFTTTITPKSLHEITNIQRKLMAIQASKVNPFLMSVQTLAEILDIPNWGKLEGDTEIDKILSMLKLQEKVNLTQQFHQFLLQIGMQSIAQSQSPEGQMAGAMQGIAGMLQGDGGSGGNGNRGAPANPEGRPPSFDKAPALAQKSDGRTTITTS